MNFIKILKKFCIRKCRLMKNEMRFFSTMSSSNITDSRNYEFSESVSENLKEQIISNFLIYENFITVSEEMSLLREIEPYLKRMRYEFDHWDDAIHGFKETERLNWNDQNSCILKRLRGLAFPQGIIQLPHTHILDLSEEGHIKPHIDSVRFCGSIIAGLSLLSDCVMKLAHKDDKDIICRLLLSRRALYIMKDAVRYEYTHEVLPNEKSEFKGKIIKKLRRISIICRNEP